MDFATIHSMTLGGARPDLRNQTALRPWQSPVQVDPLGLASLEQAAA